MPIQLQNVTVSYPGQTLFEDLTWQITAGERYGLVGPNGAGKTTLLKVLSGELAPDSGAVVRPRGVRVGYLSQAPQIPSQEATVRQVLMRPLAYLEEAQARMKILHERLEGEPALSPEEMSAIAFELSALEEKFRQGGGYALEARISELLGAFGLPPEVLDRPAAPLSGGEKSRVMLAEVLLANPDLLLLDEPTNHLDIEGTEHLEEILEKFPGAVVIISHDRYLLDRVVRRVVEVDGGRLSFYVGGYSAFTQAREKRLGAEREAFERQQEEIARQEDFIRKNIAGQKTNQAKSRRKALEKMERLMRPEDVWAQASRIGLSFESGGRAPKVVAEAAGLVKRFGDRTVLSGVDLVVPRAERVGIIGPNGSGKSTLLKCLIGKLMPDGGKAELGVGVSLGYLDQEVADRVSTKSAVEEVMELSAPLGILTNVDSTRQYLARFRFFGDDVFRATRSFSGGERTRLALAKIMLTPKNALALDEPTNHLDIPTREVLEKTLRAYDGTLIVVSHDRYFLDQVVSKIVRIEAGRAEVFLGGYSEMKSARRKELPAPAAPAKNGPAPAKNGSAASKQPALETPKSQAAVALAERAVGEAALAEPTKGARSGSAKESTEDREARHAKEKEKKKIERRLKELEEEISALETEHQGLASALAGDYGGDWSKLSDLTRKEREVKDRLERRMAEWERLGAELETA
jgi:ATP-binding cassette, subfamily F, member 3